MAEINKYDLHDRLHVEYSSVEEACKDLAGEGERYPSPILVRNVWNHNKNNPDPTPATTDPNWNGLHALKRLLDEKLALRQKVELTERKAEALKKGDARTADGDAPAKR